MALKFSEKLARAPAALVGDWPEQGQWTYADYKRLPDDGWRYEVIEGVLLSASTPKIIHQIISANLSVALHKFVKPRNAGLVIFAPVDVLLGNLATPVQPDIVFVARDREHIITADFVAGAPDLVVEILSPSNWIDDKRTKYRIYALAGVTEYWIVDPRRRTIEVFSLKGDTYDLVGKYEVGDSANSVVLTGFAVSVDEVCPAE